MPDELDTKITDILTEKLTPILEKLDALTPKEEETTEKTDTDIKLARAADILRGNLKGFLKKEKLDGMTFEQLDIANQLIAEIPQSGIKNPIEQKTPKLDADPNEWGCEVET